MDTSPERLLRQCSNNKLRTGQVGNKDLTQYVVMKRTFMFPSDKGGVYCFAHVGISVCWYVGLSHLVQNITQDYFAPKASNLVG